MLSVVDGLTERRRARPRKFVDWLAGGKLALLRRRFLPRSGSVDWPAFEGEVMGLSNVDAMILVNVFGILMGFYGGWCLVFGGEF